MPQIPASDQTEYITNFKSRSHRLSICTQLDYLIQSYSKIYQHFNYVQFHVLLLPKIKGIFCDIFTVTNFLSKFFCRFC